MTKCWFLDRENMKHWTNAGLMLANRLRSWPNITPALVQCFVLADESLGTRSSLWIPQQSNPTFLQPAWKRKLIKGASVPRQSCFGLLPLSVYSKLGYSSVIIFREELIVSCKRDTMNPCWANISTINSNRQLTVRSKMKWFGLQATFLHI